MRSCGAVAVVLLWGCGAPQAESVETRDAYAFVVIDPTSARCASHGLRFEVSAERLSVVDQLELRLRTIDGIDAPPARAVDVAGHAATVVRGDVVDEWYENGPRGLEQGFTVHRPLGSPGLTLDIESSGLTPQLRAAEVVFRDAAGRVRVHYGELYAADANGRALPARFEVEGAVVRLAIDDRDARYPVYVDPLVWNEQQKIVSSDGAFSDYFGTGLAVDENVLIAGAAENDDAGDNAGAAYVFVRAGGTWTEQQKLTPAAPQELFGSAIALESDTLVLGARGAGSGTGAAYVYVSNGAWIEQQRLTPSDGDLDDGFGGTVSLSGDTLVVGSPNGNNQAGAAYVFVRSGTTWSEQQTLTAGDAQANDLFGAAVFVVGDTAIVGAPGADAPTFERAGAIYVFVRSGTTWSETQKLVPSSAVAFDEFGRTLSGDADTVLVGAPSAVDNAGRVTVFTRSGGTWVEGSTLAASDGQSHDEFGYASSIEGDWAIVGAPEDSTPIGNAGSAYLFHREAGQWVEQQKLTAADASLLDRFGLAVALGGQVAVVGAPYDDFGATDIVGSAYVFALLGGPCSDGASCTSGFCVDDTCCEAESCGRCGACDRAGTEGLCGPAAPGDAGDGSCAPYLCDGESEACPESCTEDTQCSPGAGCDATGHCAPLGETGASCSDERECASGFCDDGVCCDAACTGPCERCDLTGHEGTCTVIDCAGYACSAAGRCLTVCGTTLDCMEGYVCTADGQCVPREAGGVDGGCGACAHARSTSGGWAALALLWTMLRRRREHDARH